MHQRAYDTKFLFIFFISLILSSCSIYTSSDRKKYETETSQAAVYNLSTAASCSDKSLKSISTLTKELYTTESSQDGSPLLVRYLVVNDQVVYETDNLKGVYCVYQNH